MKSKIETIQAKAVELFLPCFAGFLCFECFFNIYFLTFLNAAVRSD